MLSGAPPRACDRLAGRTVLVVEDEPFIALDLADAVEQAGGRVVGPAMSVSEALTLIEAHPIDAAILDFNLIDGDATPIIRRLASMSAPFVLHTGASVAATPEMGPGIRAGALRIFRKPTMPETLTQAVATMVAGGATGAGGA
ncbi:MAG: response regulator [Rubrimonas sp.]